MGFTTGAKITADIIDEISNGLIDTLGGYWTNNDITWTTANKTANLARRSLKYTNGSEVLYVALEAINANAQVRADGSYYTMSKGLRITLSASWDIINNTYPSTNQQSFIQFETLYYNKYANTAPTGNPGVNADLTSLQVTYYLWIESNGFVIMGQPEPYPTDYSQQSFFLCLERNPNKEYVDGDVNTYTNFYAYMAQNIFEQGRNGYPMWSYRKLLRPFVYQYPSSGDYDTLSFDNNGISFWRSPSYYAYKSMGNGKVYYVKPIIHDHIGEMMPIMQAELFFPFSESVGLVDGDVIAIEGVTTKYLCKSINSPDSSARLNFAIKYVA